MKLLSFFIAIVLFSTVLASAQEEKEIFLIEKEIKHLPVISQGSTGTCWSFATTSFIEAEIIRQGLPETDLSEMFFVYYGYINKLKNYLYYHGNNNFGQGGLAHDVMDIVREHGMATNKAYPGIKVNGKFRHSHLADTLKQEISALNKTRRNKFDFEEMDKLDAILVAEIGEHPKSIEINGESLDAKELPSKMKIDPDNYIELTSYSHHPFYKTFALEIPDNWAHKSYYNIPIDELIEVMYHSIENNYSVSWDGDVSEKLFQHKNGKADLPKNQRGKVDQNLRQETFLARATTDDHLMHIVGLSKDSEGRSCFYTKNSWGPDGNDHGGYLHMTDDYVRLKTVSVLVHKDAIPQNIRIKLDL